MLGRRSKRQRTNQKLIDPALESRRATAKATMESLGIAQDEIANQEPGKKQRRRCQVCFKYFDFDFNGIPHQRRILFCPLADDQQILKQYTAERDEKTVKE